MENNPEKSISDKYLDYQESEFQKYLQKKENKETRWQYAAFYGFIFVFIVLSYLTSSCSFEIGGLKFSGFKDWSGQISTLVLELVFLFIFGARCNITHLNTLLDKVSSIVKN